MELQAPSNKVKNTLILNTVCSNIYITVPTLHIRNNIYILGSTVNTISTI